MKTKNYLSIISILFFSFLFVSCSKEDEGDTIKPVIDLLEPEEGAILRIGSSHGVHFEMNLHLHKNTSLILGHFYAVL